METLILSIRLFAGEPILTFQVESCDVGIAWMEAAMSWAERSGIEKTEGPMFLCGPRQGVYVVRAHR